MKSFSTTGSESRWNGWTRRQGIGPFTPWRGPASAPNNTRTSPHFVASCPGNIASGSATIESQAGKPCPSATGCGPCRWKPCGPTAGDCQLLYRQPDAPNHGRAGPTLECRTLQVTRHCAGSSSRGLGGGQERSRTVPAGAPAPRPADDGFSTLYGKPQAGSRSSRRLTDTCSNGLGTRWKSGGDQGAAVPGAEAVRTGDRSAIGALPPA